MPQDGARGSAVQDKWRGLLKRFLFGATETHTAENTQFLDSDIWKLGIIKASVHRMCTAASPAHFPVCVNGTLAALLDGHQLILFVPCARFRRVLETGHTEISIREAFEICQYLPIKSAECLSILGRTRLHLSYKNKITVAMHSSAPQGLVGYSSRRQQFIAQQMMLLELGVESSVQGPTSRWWLAVLCLLVACATSGLVRSLCGRRWAIGCGPSRGPGELGFCTIELPCWWCSVVSVTLYSIVCQIWLRVSS